MIYSRRQFISMLVGLGAAPIVSAVEIKSLPYFYSARANKMGRYFITALDAQGQSVFDVPLPGRGHGMALHPHRHELLAFARRPGEYLLVMNSLTGEVLHELRSQTERHFYGHGVFSADGRWLYTTENHFATGQGVIGVRDALQGYQQVNEFPSYGIGPHELVLSPDHTTLIVANGGILTHPDTGRSKLNLDSMRSCLAYIDRQTGKLIADYTLPKPLHQLSMRHIAVNQAGQVAIAMQFQGSRQQRPPLIGLHQKGQAIQLLTPPSEVVQRMKNYCGSVCVDPSQRYFAISSPRGNLVTFWSFAEATLQGTATIGDGCGVAAGTVKGEFLLSGGHGGVYRYQVHNKLKSELVQHSDSLWDNHLLSS